MTGVDGRPSATASPEPVPAGGGAEAGGAVATGPGTAGDDYAAFFQALVESQDARKSSLEERGLSVITTSGALVTLLFGLVAAITGADGFELPASSHGPLGVAMVLFVVAALLGLLTNLPLFYRGVDAEGLRRAFDQWDEPKADGQVRIAATRLKLVERAQKVNEMKAWVLIVSMSAEVLAVLAVAVAVREVLANA